MATIYLVCTGSYSDRYVNAAFTTAEAAEEYRIQVNADDVEETELDPQCVVSGRPSGHHLWLVTSWEFPGSEARFVAERRSDEEAVHGDAWNQPSPWGRNGSRGSIRMFIWAENENHALKIASERRARFIAQGLDRPQDAVQ